MNRILILITFVLISAVSLAGGRDSLKTSYHKLIGSATTKCGLFKTHQIKDKLYIEIGDSLLDKDMLFAVRIAEISDNSKLEAGRMLRNPILIRFTFTNNAISIRMPQTGDVLDDVETNIKHSFLRNNIAPIMASFPIAAMSPDSSSYVIDVTKFLSEEIPYVSPFNDKSKPGRRDASGCYIDNVNVFPQNVEIGTYMSYHTPTKPFLVKLNRSIVLLPNEPMKKRLHDERIGFYPFSQRIYSSTSKRVEAVKYIKRWRLEPKSEDLELHLKGIPVEPKKPIIIYVDKAFPADLKQYVKEGIECWQPAFEAIGFKNAIQALDYPINDPDFNSEDIRYSCVRFVTSNTANAMGPSWIDPRTGEIIQGGVLFYQNVQKLIHDWRFVQTAAVDTAARRKVYSKELMGELVRYVIAHEIGHVLGQEHNMRGSYAYPVDSLRSKTFTDKFGSTASIMDYARNNYIAQPGDNVSWLSPPRLGPYDYFSIKYAYKTIPGNIKPELEKPMLNQWLSEHGNDPVYLFGEQSISLPLDPSAQQEALGDDAIKASAYGIANTKIILENLVDWTATEGDDYGYTRDIYQELIKQYNRYISHVTAYIGGTYIHNSVHNMNQKKYVPVSAQKQKEALAFLFNELRAQETWLVSNALEEKIGFVKKDLTEDQLKVLDWLMNPALFNRFILYGKFDQTSNPYTLETYLNDLHKEVFACTTNKKDLSETDKLLLTAYVTNLNSVLLPKDEKNSRSKSFYESLNTSLESNTLGKSASEKTINHLDLSIEPLIITQRNQTIKQLEKLAKKGHKSNRSFYTFMLTKF